MKKIYRYILFSFLLGTLIISTNCNYKIPDSNQLYNSSNTILEAKKSLDEVTKEYISSHIFKTNSGGKIFCSYKTIKKEEKGDMIIQYLMVNAAEYVCQNNELKRGTAVIVPVMITVESRENIYEVVNFKNPLIYDEGTGEAEKLFPEDVLHEIDSGKFSDNETVDTLNTEIKLQAKSYYNLN